MNFVLGGHGRLGSAIVSSLGDDVLILDRRIYSQWTGPDGPGAVSRYFESKSPGGVVYVAAGIIDPRRSLDEHNSINVLLPRNVIAGATALGLRVVTFGTVMEEIASYQEANSYLKSKLTFARYVTEFASSNSLILHLRMHTLYGGGDPPSHMFLGQLVDAMRQGRRFAMSSGNQLREYHHVEDEALAVGNLVKADARGIIDVSHGSPVKLIDLAAYICDKFGCPDRLDVGAIPGAPSENYSREFNRTPLLAKCYFRATLPGVYGYLQKCVEA